VLTLFVPIAASGQTAHVIGIELAPSLMILNAHPTPALDADNDAQDGHMVPLDTLVDVEQISGPNFVSRFNLYLAAEIMGTPAPGYSSAQALGAVEEVAKSMSGDLGTSGRA
jgi:hypothetical protein